MVTTRWSMKKVFSETQKIDGKLFVAVENYKGHNINLEFVKILFKQGANVLYGCLKVVSMSFFKLDYPHYV